MCSSYYRYPNLSILYEFGIYIENQISSSENFDGNEDTKRFASGEGCKFAAEWWSPLTKAAAVPSKVLSDQSSAPE